jgi:hypothetical protein
MWYSFVIGDAYTMNENFGLLSATPSFLEGVARTLDLGGTFTDYNTLADAGEADFLALRSDWQAIGEDFDAALAQYDAEEQE